MPLPTGEVLRLTALRWPAKTAIIDGARGVTFAAIDAAADRLANALVDLGLGIGHRIACLLSNRLEYAEIYFGVARTGAILCHLSHRMTEDDLHYVLDKTAPSAIIVEAQYAERIGAVRARIPSLEHVIVLGSPRGNGTLDYTEILVAASACHPAIVLSPDDPFGITFTGGTTGFPRAVLSTHRARGWTALAAAFEFNLDETDVALVSTPLFHAAALNIWFQPLVLIGATSVFMPRWDVEAMMDLVERHRITAMFSVPTQLGDLIRHPKFDAKRLGSLRKVDFAAAPMPPTLFQRLVGIFPEIEFIENYGFSEGGVVSVRPPQFNQSKAASVGRAVLGHEIAIFDADGNALPPGRVGEVVARGPATFAEYYNDPADTARARPGNDGWVWSGDMGYLDEDSFLYLVDRSKDMIISGGENIYPKEIESVVYQHPSVEECAVFGIPDERFGEVLAAHIVLKRDVTATAEEIIAFAAERVARHKRIKLVKFVDTLPKTAVGKIQKNLMRRDYWPETGERVLR